RSLSDRNQVVADPFCLIQIKGAPDHAIKNGRLGSVAPAQNFDGKRFAINHASQVMSRQPTQSSGLFIRSPTESSSTLTTSQAARLGPARKLLRITPKAASAGRIRTILLLWGPGSVTSPRKWPSPAINVNKFSERAN